MVKKKLAKYFPYQPIFLVLSFLISLIIMAGIVFSIAAYQEEVKQLEKITTNLENDKSTLKEKLLSLGKELEKLKNEDQRLINLQLKDEIKNIEKTYHQAVTVYENLLSLKELTSKTKEQDKLFAEILSLLAKKNYATASATLTKLDQNIKQEKDKIAAAFTIPENIPAENTPPGSGYRRQKVTTDLGGFMVSLVAADLNATRVIVDTSSDSDCRNDCPVLPLATYVSRSGAFAGVNGSYFCPATYPSCSDKKNSFDTLLMNKNKVYINSANNVYSSVPAAIFYSNTARFVTQSLEWGRDTGVDAVIANYPLLTFNNQVFFTGGSDPKQGSKGNRSFIGVTGSTAYIGVVHSATVAEAAKVVQALGINSALNLDDGGSTALWSGGYKVGPGRDLPNAVLLVKK